MKILLVHYRYFISGGPERYLFNVKEALEEKGHQVIPFSIKNSQNEKSEYSDFFVDNIGKSDEVFVNKYPKTLRTYCDLVFREFYSFSVKKKLKRLIRETQPDVCYLLVYKRALSPSVIDACVEMGVPVVNRISDYNPVCGAASLYRGGKFCKECFRNNDKGCLAHKCIKGSRVFSLMRYLSIQWSKWKHFNDKINTFICTNGFMEEMMLDRQLVSPGKIVVNPTFFKEKDIYKTVDKTNCLSDVVEMLYIGNIDESKGIYDLLSALSVLKDKCSNFHLSIVGGLHASENERVQKIIKDNGIDKYITFQPFRKDGRVFEYYLKANITILPARWAENLPNTLIESLYFHRPVVVPYWGSFKFTTSEEIAYRYEALSYHSLADTLYNICSHPDTIHEKSLACEGFFQEHYSEEKHIETLIRVFNQTINKNENI